MAVAAAALLQNLLEDLRSQVGALHLHHRLHHFPGLLPHAFQGVPGGGGYLPLQQGELGQALAIV